MQPEEPMLAQTYKATQRELERLDTIGGTSEDVLDRLHNQRETLEAEAIRRAHEGTPDVLRALAYVLRSHLYDASDPDPEIIRATADAMEAFLGRNTQ